MPSTLLVIEGREDEDEADYDLRISEDAEGALVFERGPGTRRGACGEEAELVREILAARGDLRTVLTGFDRGVFLRSTEHDHEAGWAIALLPFLVALGRLAKFAGHLAQEDSPSTSPSTTSSGD